ncbi:MAG: aldo/keto reductase [Candidatus Schekmanbacteria bacterium]|nr:aldo/keto reductase [Candidatus Schekmanbacteria bacterium]
MSLSHATAEGTARFQARFAGILPAEHFRSHCGLTVSSIGIGTYLGSADATTDQLYEDAICHAVEGGVNLIDTAINYRCMRSERTTGRALQRLLLSGRISRDEVLVATKGGYLPFDSDIPDDPYATFMDAYYRPAILDQREVVSGCHAISPRFIADQISRSRRNLELETIDIYYLHNPEEQLDEIDRSTFVKRLTGAFEALEHAASKGEIQMYGVATWNGFRLSEGEPGYLSLSEVVDIAMAVGGEGHRFRVVQLPFNVAMCEALTKTNQVVRGEHCTLVEAANRFDIAVVASASLLQARLCRDLPRRVTAALPGLRTDAQRSLQFARSAPGIKVALVGMKHLDHVEENLAVAALPPMTAETFSAALVAH